jgi:hypothetical protein
MTFAETALKLAKAMATEDGKAELKKLWDTLDKNGDGKVSGKEWGSAVYKNKELLAKFFGGATLQEMGQMFNEIDEDNSDSLTWDEFSTQSDSYLTKSRAVSDAALKLAQAMATEDGKAEFKKLWDTEMARSPAKSGARLSIRTRSSWQSTLAELRCERLVRCSTKSMRTTATL